ncbi:LPXTG cell wall anchor domain-containing protein [Amnibacterium flavum]|uniref:Gram-positive cocci surface proteins LPxTG domain-containing protein n=1 Tax=Amnibacterium flavum TaxID=2173173 RepID=A0A2V1HNW8_9MICO|nr:LPXTG cell wall anchor domain-containing protein [Amnibacterium flavum]PVZ94215.1 hypothetical protein DDQ50_10755 [Amnibacterium flavum]
MISPTRTPFRRASALAVGGALALGGAFVAAAPAHAVPNETYYVYSTAGFATADGPRYSDGGVEVKLYDLDTEDLVGTTTTSPYGDWSFSDVVDGDYVLVFTSKDYWYPADDEELLVTVEDAEPEVEEVLLTPYPELGGGAVTVTGNPVLGETLTATVGAYTGANNASVTPDSVEYSWGYSRGESGDSIEGATGLSVVVPEEAVGAHIGLSAIAEKDGYSPTITGGGPEALVSAPQKPAAPAPVADSSGLAAFLAANYAAEFSSEAVGLPKGSLSSDSTYTAKMDWYSGDSFVDVYAYSSPRLVGTFPVVDGVVQVTLTPAILAMIGSGSHTLVYVGQSSGGVQSVALEISAALASTGADITAPLIGGSVLLVLGGVLLVARRRKATKA